MNTLLLFFALPVATIILAIVFEQIIDSPILVGLTAFAIYLIVTFAAFNESFLIYAIVYTILAYFAAVLADYIRRIINNNQNSCNCNNNNSDNYNYSNSCNCNAISSDNSNISESDNCNRYNSCKSNKNDYDEYNNCLNTKYRRRL